MFFRTLALLAVVSSLLAACSRSSTPEPLAEARRVAHLTNGAPLEYRTAGGLTRPSVELPDEGAAVWPVAAGPARVVRTAFVSSPGRGRLLATIRAASGASLATWGAETAGTGAWTEWTFTLPELERPAALEIRFHGPGASDRIVVAQPTLSRPARKSPRIFILFDVDTLRMDHVSLYGYGRPTTPSIDRYFRAGSMWRNAFSNVPWTLPSHVTMFTSTLPGEHGVGERRDTIPSELPTLAAVLSASGYRTLGVTNGYFVDSSWGFARGFDEYRDLGMDRDVMAEIDGMLDLLRRYRGDPVFVFFHTYALHDYVSPLEPARELLGDFAGLGPLPHRMPFLIPRSAYTAHAEEDVRRWMVNRYDVALRNVDDAFGRLLEGLESRGVLGDATILLTSDHGEELYDRFTGDADPYARIGHIHPSLYDEYLRVPFLLRGSRPLSRRIVDDPVSLVDLAPTVLDALGIPSPPAFHGRSLLRNEPARAPEPILISGPGMDAVAVRERSLKMIERTAGPIVAWDTGARFDRLRRSECFDVDADPDERKPVPCESARFAAVRRRIEQLVAGGFPGSLVLRVSQAGPAGILGLSSRSDGRPPSIRAFGIPGLRAETSGDGVRAGITAGVDPVWVGIEPGEGSRVLDVELFGPLAGRYAPSDGSSAMSLAWPDARGPRPSPWNASTFFTTANESYRGDPSTGADGELFARLRSIGYLGSRGALSPLRTGPASGSPEPPATVRIRIHPELPVWAASGRPTPRSIRALIPESTAAGTPFRVGTNGTSELQVIGTGFTPRDRIFLDTLRISTIYLDDSNLLGMIPANFLSRPGSLSLAVRDVTNPSAPDLTAEFVVSPPR